MRTTDMEDSFISLMLILTIASIIIALIMTNDKDIRMHPPQQIQEYGHTYKLVK